MFGSTEPEVELPSGSTQNVFDNPGSLWPLASRPNVCFWRRYALVAKMTVVTARMATKADKAQDTAILTLLVVEPTTDRIPVPSEPSNNRVPAGISNKLREFFMKTEF